MASDTKSFDLEKLNLAVSSRNVPEFYKLVIILKKKFTNKSAAISFLSKDLKSYQVLLGALNSLLSAQWVVRNSSTGTTMFKELLSLFANLCHLSVTAATELRKFLAATFASSALKVLESGLGLARDTSLKATLLRLLSNLADYRETVSLVTNYSSLLDKVVLLLNDGDKQIYENALRVIRQIVKQKNQIKHVIMSNVGYQCGIRILGMTTEQIIQDSNLLSAMDKLSKSHLAKDFTRQLGQSMCAQNLLALLYFEPTGSANFVNHCKKWKQFIVYITKTSFYTRESYHRSVITDVIDTGAPTMELVSFLNCFSQDAYGRTTLRTKGGLNIVLDRIPSITDIDELAEVVSSFKNFIHDAPGLSFICHKPQLMELCLKLMEEVLESNKESQEDHESKVELLQKQDQLESAVRGEVDFRICPREIMHPSTIPPSPFRYNSYSPQNYSPANSPTYFNQMGSPGDSVSSAPTSRDTSPLRSEVYLSPTDLLPSTSSQSSQSVAVQTEEQLAKDTRLAIINDCIWLYRFLTHDDSQLDCLVSKSTLTGFVKYLANSPKISEKLFHTLKGVVRSRVHIEKLLEMKFPLMILFDLIRQPCIITRFSSSCMLCLERARFGVEILGDFVAEVDSPFGMGILEKLASKKETWDSDYTKIQSLIVLRHRERRNRFFNHFKAHKVLDKLFNMLLDCKEEDVDQILWFKDALAAYTFMLPRKYITKVISPLEGYYEDIDACRLETPDHADAKVLFTRLDGTVICEVKKEALTHTEGYFQGLFEHDFIENSSSESTFVFDGEREECDEDDFLNFIHFISGCRDSECVAVNDVKTCVALLHLSDKYLCFSLSEQILRANGVARRLIAGDNLIFFLPVILKNWVYRNRLGDVVVLIFFKFSTSHQQMDILKAMAGNSLALANFREMVDVFLKKMEEAANPPPVFIPWDF